MPEKVKIVKALDNDTFLVQAKGWDKPRSMRLESNTGKAWYDGFEKDQSGFKIHDAVKALEGKEVDVTFKKQSPSDYKKNYDREQGSIATATIPDLAEHLFKENQVYKRVPGGKWEAGKQEPLDSLYTPQGHKAVKSLLIKKEAASLDPNQRIAYVREIQDLKTKFDFKTDQQVVDFVNRRSKIPYDQLKTFQKQTPSQPTVIQPTMATPATPPSKGTLKYKDPSKNYQTISVDQADALIAEGKITGTKVDLLKQHIQELGAEKDVTGYEYHTTGTGKNYLFPIFKGESKQRFQEALKNDTSGKLAVFGNEYATNAETIQKWKDQFGIVPTSATGISSGVKGKVAEGVAGENSQTSYFPGKLEAPKRNNISYINTETNSRFLTKNLISPKKEETLNPKPGEDKGPIVKSWGSLGAGLGLNLLAIINPEPVTSGGLNSSANIFMRDAFGESYTDNLALNAIDDLMGFSGAAGYVTGGAGFAGELASTANSGRKTAQILDTARKAAKADPSKLRVYATSLVKGLGRVGVGLSLATIEDFLKSDSGTYSTDKFIEDVKGNILPSIGFGAGKSPKKAYVEGAKKALNPKYFVNNLTESFTNVNPAYDKIAKTLKVVKKDAGKVTSKSKVFTDLGETDMSKFQKMKPSKTLTKTDLIKNEKGLKTAEDLFNKAIAEKSILTKKIEILKSKSPRSVDKVKLQELRERLQLTENELVKLKKAFQFKQGGTLKFQRGGGIPKFQKGFVTPQNTYDFQQVMTDYNSQIPPTYPSGIPITQNTWNKNSWATTQASKPSTVSSVSPSNYDILTNPTYGINNYLQYPTLKPNGTKYTYNLQKDLNKRFNAGLVQDGVYGTKTARAQGFANSINYSPLPSEPLNVPEEKAVGYDGMEYGEVSRLAAIDGISSQHWKGGGSGNVDSPSNGASVNTNNYKQGPRFGYQEANLALSILPSLLNTKVKADRLSYKPYNPEIRGIQGDPLLQQRLTSIAQNKYLQNKATSSDPSQELVRRLIVNRQAIQGNQDAYNIDTQARIADTQRYYGERNAANQFNYTNKQNIDNQNIQMNNAAMMQNAAQKNQVTGQTIQNVMGYMTNKANDRNLLNQNYLAHKNIERQGLLDNITNQYKAMYNAAPEADRPRIQMEWEKALSEARAKYGVDEIYRNAQGYVPYQLMYKKGGSISDATRLEGITTKKGTDTDKLFIQTAYKYNELSSKVSTEALNRGAKLVVATLNNLPKSTLKSLPFKKLF